MVQLVPRVNPKQAAVGSGGALLELSLMRSKERSCLRWTVAWRVVTVLTSQRVEEAKPSGRQSPFHGAPPRALRSSVKYHPSSQNKVSSRSPTNFIFFFTMALMLLFEEMI